MEAFEQLVKVFLEAEGYIVTSDVKFPVRNKTKKVKYDEYQVHGYEVDVVAAKNNSLLLGSVKSFFGSGGVDRQCFIGCVFFASRNSPKLQNNFPGTGWGILSLISVLHLLDQSSS